MSGASISTSRGGVGGGGGGEREGEGEREVGGGEGVGEDAGCYCIHCGGVSRPDSLLLSQGASQTGSAGVGTHARSAPSRDTCLDTPPQECHPDGSSP